MLQQVAGALAVADHRDPGAAPLRPQHFPRLDPPPVRQRDRLPARQQAALLPLRHAKLRQPFAVQRLARRLLEQEAEAVGCRHAGPEKPTPSGPAR